jgi:long-chain acyl-CoA synthetase
MMTDWICGEENAERIAFLDREARVTFRQLRQRISAVRRALRQLQGGRIAIYLPNGADFAAALFGAVTAGATAYPLNALLTKYEVDALAAQAEVSAVITSKARGAQFEDWARAGRSVIYIEDIDLAGAPEMYAPPALDDDAAAVFLSTSGTTGNTKIVQLSKRNIEASLAGYLDKMAFETNDGADIRFIVAVPFSSAYGIMCLCACMTFGFAIASFGDHFSLELFYRAIEAHGVTHYEGGPLVLQFMEQMIGRAVPYDISSLKYIGFGGSKISAKTITRIHEAYPQIEIAQGYGMSEAAPLIAKHVRHARLEGKKLGSVGTAIKGVEIAVDVAGSITNSAFQEGEIVMRGDNVMLGYYRNEEETRKAIRNGYLYTGDIGYLDDKGHLYISGRKKSCIIVRGFNVQPEEVEECILNGGFARDCLVYGGTDALENEALYAQVVPSHPDVTAEAIKAHSRSHLAGYKCPREIRFCEAIEKTASGKTKRTRAHEE